MRLCDFEAVVVRFLAGGSGFCQSRALVVRFHGADQDFRLNRKGLSLLVHSFGVFYRGSDHLSLSLGLWVVGFRVVVLVVGGSLAEKDRVSRVIARHGSSG